MSLLEILIKNFTFSTEKSFFSFTQYRYKPHMQIQAFERRQEGRKILTTDKIISTGRFKVL